MTATPRREAMQRLAAFGAISMFAALRWADLDAGRADGRAALSVLPVLLGAGVWVWLRGPGAPEVSRRSGALLVVVGGFTTLVAVYLLAGMPVRLLAPGAWGQLVDGIGNGVSGLSAATYPYRGSEEWVPRVLSLLLPLAIGLAAFAAFCRGDSRGSPRLVPLVLILMTYGIAATLSPPASPALNGLVLLALLGLWAWLPSPGRHGAAVAVGLVLAAGLAAMPLAARLDPAGPWIDYSKWNLFSSAPSEGEFFGWNHSYGPLDWPRTGRTLLTVRSNEPHYWRAVTLDDFDGYRWVGSGQPAEADRGLPLGSTGASLNPDWVHTVSFDVGDLSGNDVVGAGAILSTQGLEDAAPTAEGVSIPEGQLLAKGDSYSARVYTPEPTRARLAATPAAESPVLQRFTQVSLPIPSAIAGAGFHDSGIAPVAVSAGKPSFIQVSVPLRGSGRSSAAAERIAASPYAAVLRLSHRLEAGHATTYGVVRAISGYLRRNYTYNESPPARVYALRAFLFRDRIGYCQQFSGAMALMLRMDGIPSRVASGFSPGEAKNGKYVVTDFDAHSWVEVYFRDIGWVTFDPTPGAAPAHDRSVEVASTVPAPRSRPLPEIPGGKEGSAVVAAAGGASGASPVLLAAVALVLLAMAGGFVWQLRRVRRLGRLDPAALSTARALELRSAVIRLRGKVPGGEPTLLRLERRLRSQGTSSSARYAAELRMSIYGAGPSQAPTGAERRRVRRELAGRVGGWRRRLEAILAMPPFGPSRRFLDT